VHSVRRHVGRDLVEYEVCDSDGADGCFGLRDREGNSFGRARSGELAVDADRPELGGDPVDAEPEQFTAPHAGSCPDHHESLVARRQRFVECQDGLGRDRYEGRLRLDPGEPDVDARRRGEDPVSDRAAEHGRRDRVAALDRGGRGGVGPLLHERLDVGRSDRVQPHAAYMWVDVDSQDALERVLCVGACTWRCPHRSA